MNLLIIPLLTLRRAIRLVEQRDRLLRELAALDKVKRKPGRPRKEHNAEN